MEIPAKQEAKFWSKVDKSGDCWLGTQKLDWNGYGRTQIAGTRHAVHRVAYTLAKGAIPEGLLVDHMCHVKHCVRPAHLRLATHKQNMENRPGVTHWNETGIRGVTWDLARKKYTAIVGHNGKNIFLGRYDDKEVAERVVIAKRNELFTHNDADRLTGVTPIPTLEA